MSTRHMAARACGRSGSEAEAGLRDVAPTLRSRGQVTALPLLPVGLGNIDVEADRNRNVPAPR
jgi:hypothetical protein